MPDSESPITPLSTEQCERLLENNTLGRLAVSVGDNPDIFPINYAFYENTVYFRTAEGSKLGASVINPRVAFEIDGYSDSSAWSVVVKGSAKIYDSEDDDTVAQKSGLNPWVPTIKMNLVGITPDEITGRLFRLGAQPDISI